MEILEPVENEIAAAVKAFFEHWNPEEALTSPALVPMKEEILAGGNLLFYVDGVYPQEDFEIKERWKEYLKDSSKAPDGLCMVTGRHSEIARTHGTIKGVQGAQSSGAALVSFNATAFESYGKEQSYNAPVGTYAAFAYTTALNYLLRNRKYFCTIGDTTVVYWAENGLEEYQNVFSAVSEPSVDNQEIVAGVFQNLSSGKAVDVEGITTKLQMSQKFFILGLAPNAARIAVRFFYQDSFGNILQHLQQHYRRMEIVKPLTDTMENLPGFGFN
ncbi:type I-C CRISPR-associated protein Cas8c/Csd1 [Lactonifactor longoviformis]|uniref:type I-C CRISPR-associated protein Cas8c/Csd1 n=1 Tax=Lactonifactor longoviformis TaxID=341220 RepID=UPI001D013FA2|nr:type I-C CRISPR-associated protein Cas8c/Csd1 [Lactonifactor longoviformis]MCB5713802.1 type I-C CRISPR-associated protein Cas8c/Csd1 [Lactonifactor longoviformis]MCB5717824.1 type I-C CRISPR-associated protein Cas8c/Csd1 [Lactonifactor longoviformis]